MARILCTKKIPDEFIQTAQSEGVDFFVREFIAVRPNLQGKDISLIHALLQKEEVTVIFTSKHAVYSLHDFIRAKATDFHPKWKVYCIASATREAVRHCFPAFIIQGIASYAEELANLILVNDHVKEAWFFCGNLRRDVLPDKLSRNGIKLHEVTVYETIPTPQSVEENYNGIIFFSPSGVESFFSKNKIDQRVTCFAIGETTASAIKKYTSNNLVTSLHQKAEDLIKTCIEYYKRARY